MRHPALMALFGLILAWPVMAVSPDEKERRESALEEIIVTAARVRQGGAQDIKHFRSIAQDVGMPRPESLTVEGLLGEHDLAMSSDQPCAQYFCLITESRPAEFATRPDDVLFVALGFSSNIDAAKWKRQPLDLVAVVDKSGSMNGVPLARVRQSLKQIVQHMTDQDRISIVLYGDRSHVYLAPTTIKGQRASVLQAIDTIASAGSTNMEAGLKVGYETAFADKQDFKGVTRLMLFTDEQPNVGRVDADSFMSMATEASRRGIGLTTIGVGVQFDGALATKVSSVRGGNLFFLGSDQDVVDLFDKQFDTMVSELAHDLTIRMRAASGYRVSGVFGVPDTTLSEASDGVVSITVPTVFLSTQGGGIYVTLAKSSERAHLPPAPLATNAALLNVDLQYVSADSGVMSADHVAVSAPSKQAGSSINLAHALVDEYLVLHEATTAFHLRNDPKTAHQLLTGLASRLNVEQSKDLLHERQLVSELVERAALYAGYGGELPQSMRHLGVIGKWEITAIDGIADLRRGDRLQFSVDRDMTVYRKRENYAESDVEPYQINEKQLYLEDSELVFTFTVNEQKMMLRIKDSRVPEVRIALRRLPINGG